MQALDDCGLLPDLLSYLDKGDTRFLETIPFFERELEYAARKELLQHPWTPDILARMPDGEYPFRRRWTHIQRAIEFAICACGAGVRFVDGWDRLSDRCPKCTNSWRPPTLQFEWQLMDLPMRAVQEIALKHAREHHYDRWSDDEEGWSDDDFGDYDSDGDEFSRRWRKPEEMRLTDLRLSVVQPLTITALGLHEVALRTTIMYCQKTELQAERTLMWNEEQRTRAANEFAVLYEHELKMRAQYRAMRARGGAALAFALSDSLSLLPKKF